MRSTLLVVILGSFLLVAPAAAEDIPCYDLKSCQQGCDAGVASSCFMVGIAYHAGLTVERDEKRGEKLLKIACDSKLKYACTEYGRILLARDDVRGIGLQETSCTRKDAVACVMLSQEYASGKFVTADPKKAAALLHQSCELGEPVGCALVGNALVLDTSNKSQIAAATPWWERGCKGGNGMACANVSWAFATDPLRSPAERHAANERACFLRQGDTCAELGIDFVDGRGTKADAQRGARMLGYYCENGTPDEQATSCAAVDRAEKLAKISLLSVCRDSASCEASCSGGNSRACARAGDLRERSPGALALFRKSCDAGDQYGCAGQASLLFSPPPGVKRDAPRALALAHTASAKGIPEASHLLGDAYLWGDGIEKDLVKAREEFTKACKAGLAWACSALSTGLEPDRALQRANAGKSCQLGAVQSCVTYAIKLTNDHVDPGFAEGIFESSCAAARPLAPGASAEGMLNFAAMACRGHASALLERNSPARSMISDFRGCAAGDVSSCRSLGRPEK